MPKSEARKRRSRLQVNYGFLLKSTLLFALVAAVLGTAYWIQLGRVSATLKVQSSAAEKLEEFDRASELLDRYLSLNPNDTSELVRALTLREQVASSTPPLLRSAVSFAFRVLGALRAETPPDSVKIGQVQKTLVRLLMKRATFERPAEALSTFTEAQSILMDMAPTIAQEDQLWVRENLAICIFWTRRSPEAAVKKGGSMSRDGGWQEEFIEQTPLQAITSVLDEGSTSLDVLECASNILINPEASNYAWDDAAVKLPATKRMQLIQSYFERAAPAHTQESRFFASRAFASQQLNPRQAEADFRKAVELDPKNLGLIKTTAAFFFRRYLDNERLSLPNESTAARDESWKYVNLATGLTTEVDPQLVMLQGQLLASEEKYDDAVTTLSKLANRADEQGISARMAVADLLSRQGKYDELMTWTKETETLLATAQFDSRARRNDLSLVNDRQRTAGLIRSGRYREALGVLKRIKQQEVNGKTNLFDELMLGDCYYALGDFGSAEKHMETALKTASDDQTLLRKLAAVKVSLFRPVEAAATIRKIPSKTMEDWLLLGKSIFLAKSVDRTSDGTVQELEQALRFAREASVNQNPSKEFQWNLDLFELLAKSQREDATKITKEQFGLELMELIDRYPGEEQLAIAVMSILTQENMKELAQQVREQTIKHSPNSWLSVSVKVDQALSSQKTTEAFQILQAHLASHPNENAAWTAMTRLYAFPDFPFSSDSQAWDLLPKVSPMQFNSILRQWMRLPFDIPLSQEAFDHWVTRTQSLATYLTVHPDSTPSWSNVLKTSIAVAKAERESASEPLEPLVANCKTEHESLPEVHLLAGRLAILQSKHADALVHLREAEKLGLSTDRVSEVIVSSLLLTGRVAEASLYLKELGESVFRSGRLSQLAITMASSEEGNRLEVARKAANLRPSDPISWITLTNLLIFEAKKYPLDQRKRWTDEALGAIQKANSIRPLDPVIEKAFLFDIAIALGEREGALEVLKQLVQTEAKPPLAKNLTVASMHESLGQLTEGIAVLEAARVEYPDDNRLLENLGKLYHATNQIDSLIQILGIQLAKDPENVNLRRRYASQLAFRGRPEDWERADKLLKNEGVETTDVDNRISVQLLLTRGREADLTKAQALMEKLIGKSPSPTAADRFALAQIYERSLRLSVSRNTDQQKMKDLREKIFDLIRSTVSTPSPDVQHLLFAVRFCLENGMVEDAKSFTARVESLGVNSFEAFEAKARIHVYENAKDLASQELERWVSLETAQKKDNASRAEIFRRASVVFKSLEIFDKALEYAKKAYDESPDNGLYLVSIVGDPKNQAPRNDVIAQLRARAEKTRAAVDAILLGDLIAVSPADSLELKSLEPFFNDMLQSHPDDLRLQFTLANMYLSRGNTEEASRLYRSILEKNPANSAALNNLANILLEDPTSVAEALSCIEKALFQEPGNALMLDTKGSILLKMDKPQEAIQVLESAMTVSNDPRIGLHLFDSLKRAGRNEEAANILRKIDREELSRSLLSPDDQKILDSIKNAP
jgi:tetratricopeptide (TPR) repeat protein